MQPTAFISHASVDSVQAVRLAGLLEQHGVRCWIAPRDITPGRPYANEIVRGIDGCAAFVLLATTASLSSPNVLNELEQAHRSSRTLYTVMVNQPKVPSDASYYVARLHWLETDGNDLENIAVRLSEVMNGIRGWEAVATAPSLTRSIRNALPAFGGAFAAIMIAILLLSVAGAYLVRRERRNAAIDYRSLGWTTLGNVSASGDPGAEAKGRVWLGDQNLTFSHVSLEVVATSSTGQQQQYSPELPPNGTGEAPFNLSLPTDLSTLDTRLAVTSSAEQARFCVAQHFTILNGDARQSGSPLVKQLLVGETCR